MNGKNPPRALVFLMGIFLASLEISAAESAEDLLRASEKALSTANSFSVEYSATLRSGGETVWAALEGKLFFKNGNRYFFTNIGNLFLVLSANRTWMSNGKDFLDVLWQPANELGPSRNSVLDWDPGRLGPLSRQECTKRIVREGFTFLVAALVHDDIEQAQPVLSGLPGFSVYPASLRQQSSITNAQLLADESAGEPARHIQYSIYHGTNGPEKVDLWLRPKSFLPVKRVSVPPRMGAELTETYSFILNPKLDSALFEPKRFIREQNLVKQIAQAEKPDSRLLKAAS